MSKITETTWGIEATENNLWIGPMRADGVKVDDIVAHFEVGPNVTEAADKRNRECGAIIAAAPVLMAALKTCRCPLPAIGRPDDETVETCMQSGSCGCECGKAIAKAEGQS